MSWKAEVQADGTGDWCSNALRFPTRKMAEEYALDLMVRWTAVRAIRATECDEPATEGLDHGEVKATAVIDGLIGEWLRKAVLHDAAALCAKDVNEFSWHDEKARTYRSCANDLRGVVNDYSTP